jgi:alkanesulfonate monooxygenase SsuD/methylene tetrahydromethanopterin reductase-like flavin-dependent oxidoreductase (luciferase family)
MLGAVDLTDLDMWARAAMRPVPDVAGLVTFAIEAERAGLDAVMVSEHVVLVSWHRDEYDALGVPFGQRGEILDEQLERAGLRRGRSRPR